MALVHVMVLCVLLTSPAYAQDCEYESFAPHCNDGDPINGYWWFDFWIPGLPDVDSWFRGWQAWNKGNAVYYAPGVMEATAEVRGISLQGTLGAVSALSCADMGHRVYLRAPSLGVDWEGPYVVVDCGQRNDIFGNVVVRGEVVELGWETWVRWGASGMRVEDVEVSKVHPSMLHGEPIDFPAWWGSQVTFSTYSSYAGEDIVYSSPSTWRIRGEWTTFYPPIPPPPVPPSVEHIETPEPVRLPLYPYDKRAIVLHDEPDELPLETFSLEEKLMELTAQQIALLSAIATGAVWFLTVVYSGWLKLPKPSENVMKGVVFVGSVILAYFWAGVQLPAFDGDVFLFVGNLFAASSAIFAVAKLIYDILWKPIVDWLSRTTGLAFLYPKRL